MNHRAELIARAEELEAQATEALAKASADARRKGSLPAGASLLTCLASRTLRDQARELRREAAECDDNLEFSADAFPGAEAPPRASPFPARGGVLPNQTEKKMPQGIQSLADAAAAEALRSSSAGWKSGAAAAASAEEAREVEFDQVAARIAGDPELPARNAAARAKARQEGSSPAALARNAEDVDAIVARILASGDEEVEPADVIAARIAAA